MLIHGSLKIRQKLRIILIIFASQDDNELIASYSIYRTVLKNPANQSACIYDQHITKVMTVMIIDCFKPVDIKHDQGKLRTEKTHLLLHPSLCLLVGSCIFHPGQCDPISQAIDVVYILL